MDDIERLKERNKRVEIDKAWETSMTRRGVIAVMTYVVASVWLVIIENEHPFLNALVPFGGYVFSTWSLPFLKTWWVKRQYYD